MDDDAFILKQARYKPVTRLWAERLPAGRFTSCDRALVVFRSAAEKPFYIRNDHALLDTGQKVQT